jgi:hypothetical protein
VSDPCCHLCKGAHGICLSRFQCNHHIEADKQDDANHRARQLYYNPTQDTAIANVMREKRKER